jgi:hypothetical protein
MVVKMLKLIFWVVTQCGLKPGRWRQYVSPKHLASPYIAIALSTNIIMNII